MSDRDQALMKIFRQKARTAVAVARTMFRRATAASAEESRIMFRVLSRDGGTGTMIDVGAHFGESLRPFAQAGWQVHAFEPDQENRRALSATVKGFPDVRVDPRAVSDQVLRGVTFYRSEESSGISSLTPFHASHRAADNVVETVTLAVYLDHANVQTVDLLKIDTEGHDLPVLRSFPWLRLQPRAVLCEFEDSKTEALGYDYHDLARFLVAKGYQVMVSEWHPVVRYGSEHRWRAFRRYPTDLPDGAWGNLLAFRTSDDFDAAWSRCRRFQRIHRLFRWLPRRAS
jgi:FkbM family methyltransferase